MATISSQFVLNDRMTGVLQGITKSVNLVISSFESMQETSGRAIDVAALRNARNELAGVEATVQDMAEEFQRAEEARSRFTGGIGGTGSAVDALGGKLKGVLATMTSIAGLRGVLNWVSGNLDLSNTQRNAETQLRAVLANMDVGGVEVPVSVAAAPDVAVPVTADTTQVMSAFDAISQKAAEIQSRGIYGDEAMLAGAAEFATYFSDAEAIVSMMDTLADYAMGMTGGGALDASAMTDYATNLGKIMSGSFDAMSKKGFEFTETQKAIIEGLATQEQIVETLGAEYLDASSDMQAAAVINQIIAEGWSGLYETMSNTPEGQIIQLQNRFGDLREELGTRLYGAVGQVAELFEGRWGQIETIMHAAANAAGLLVTALGNVAAVAIDAGSFLVEHWDAIAPLVFGATAAVGAYTVAMRIYNTVQAVSNGLQAIAAARSALKAGASLAEAAATTTAAGAQAGLNAALLASPVTWVVAGVVALVVALVAVARAVAKNSEVAGSTFGVIMGWLSVAWAAIKNTGLVIANVAVGIWNALGAVCTNIGTAFHNVIANVQGWFYGLLSTVLTVVAGIAEALNRLPFVSFDYSGLTAKADEYAAHSAEAYGSTAEYVSVTEAFQQGFDTNDAFSEGWARNAYQAGAAWGDGLSGKVSGWLDGLIPSHEPEDWKDLYSGSESQVQDGAWNSLSDDVGDISRNTGNAADSLEKVAGDLTYLRDLAEREAVNTFTTAEIHIEITNNNSVASDYDLDGMVNALTARVEEAILSTAEGVHV